MDEDQDVFPPRPSPPVGPGVQQWCLDFVKRLKAEGVSADVAARLGGAALAFLAKR